MKLFFLDDRETQLVPGRVPTEIGAKILGVRPEDMPELARKKIAVPLGHPPKTSPKYYSTTLLLEIARDPIRMAKISDAIVNFWSRKNKKRNDRGNVPRSRTASAPIALPTGKSVQTKTAA